jgi:polar amino acid transport system substrate-binding protein
MAEPLRIICVNLDAPPLLFRERDGKRDGYEPAVTELVAGRLGRPIEWVFRPWAEMVPSLLRGDGDAIWSGQGITAKRRQVVDFTRPYAIFDESVIVHSRSGVKGPEDLVGLRVAAIADSTNMALAETFPGIVTVAFDGAGTDVFGDMIGALRRGEVDAVVDDDVVVLPLEDDPELEIAFTAPTRNKWGVAVAKDRPDLRNQLDLTIGDAIADGSLERVWREWMPWLSFPRADLDSWPPML